MSIFGRKTLSAAFVLGKRLPRSTSVVGHEPICVVHWLKRLPQPRSLCADSDWWCKYLLTPGGVLLDLFCGSGTMLAARLDNGDRVCRRVQRPMPRHSGLPSLRSHVETCTPGAENLRCFGLTWDDRETVLRNGALPLEQVMWLLDVVADEGKVRLSTGDELGGHNGYPVSAELAPHTTPGIHEVHWTLDAWSVEKAASGASNTATTSPPAPSTPLAAIAPSPWQSPLSSCGPPSSF